jgi:uncharacterized protein YjbI with pentapeptide repeats
MRRCLLVTTLLAAGLGLSSCGTSASVSKFVASRDCTVSVTNFDLAGCNLAGKNLSGDDLQSDDFQNANLAGANLAGANLQGANLRGADVKGVTTNLYTICVNAESGPCTKPDLRSGSTANAAQGQ